MSERSKSTGTDIQTKIYKSQSTRHNVINTTRPTPAKKHEYNALTRPINYDNVHFHISQPSYSHHFPRYSFLLCFTLPTTPSKLFNTRSPSATAPLLTSLPSNHRSREHAV